MCYWLTYELLKGEIKACGIKESWRIGIAQGKEESKNSKVFLCGSTRLAQYSNLDMHQACVITWLVTWYVDIASFWSWSGKGTWSLFTYSLTGRNALLHSLLSYFTLLFPFTLLLFLFTLLYFPLLFYLDKINLISLFSFFGQKYSESKNYSFSHLQSIILPLESKQCPLTLALVLACADSADELRFRSMRGFQTARPPRGSWERELTLLIDQISPRLRPWQLEFVLISEIRIKYAEIVPFPKFKLLLPSKSSSLTLLSAAFSHWSVTRLRHNRVKTIRTLSFYSFACYHQLAYFPEANLFSTSISSGI